jgi:hypothetical protein
MPGDLLIVRAIEIIVPLIMAFALGTIPIPTTILDPVMGVFASDDISSISSALTLVALIQRA